MDRVPVEVWQQILRKLVDYRDSENAKKTCQMWRNALEPLKSTWKFEAVFPHLFEYLSKSDILGCRSVSKHWRNGVDHFLENNAYHRPAAEEVSGSGEDFKTDTRLETLESVLKAKELDYHRGSNMYSKREQILREAVGHPGCPIVGRSISISERTTPSAIPNSEYLKAFGEHIWFLKIGIFDLPTVESLKRIVGLLSLVPNLKTLVVKGYLVSQAEEQISNFVKTFQNPTDGERPTLPQLEALQVSISCCQHVQFKESLLQCLSTSQTLQSLEMNAVINLPTMQLGNLVDLSLTINSELVFPQLLQLPSPLRRLSLGLWSHVHSSMLLEAVKHFGGTLRNLELNLLPDYFSPVRFPRENFLERFKSFGDSEIFMAEMKCLKRVTLNGCPPPSLNFLCGLYRTLEYLYVSSEFVNQGWRPLEGFETPPVVIVPIELGGIEMVFVPGHPWDHPRLPMVPSLDCNEEVDLLEKLRWGTLGIFKSNLWMIFKKLRVITVNWLKRDLEMRRDAYDKYNDNKK